MPILDLTAFEQLLEDRGAAGVVGPVRRRVADRAGVGQAGHAADLGRHRLRVVVGRGELEVVEEVGHLPRVIAASENGWAGHVCLPWPSAVTSSAAGRSAASRPAARPPRLVPPVEAGRRAQVGERRQRRDRHPRLDGEPVDAVVHLHRLEDLPQHDRPLVHPDRLQRASASGRSPARTRATRWGRASSSTIVQPSPANRFDIGARCNSTTSPATPTRRAAGGSSHRATMRPNRSSCAAGLIVLVERLAERQGRVGQGRCSAAFSSRHRSHQVGMDEGLGRVEAVERDHQPIEPLAVGRAASRPRGGPRRWPSRRAWANTSSSPCGPSSAAATSSTQSRFARYDATSSRPNSSGRVRRPANSRRAPCAAAS